METVPIFLLKHEIRPDHVQRPGVDGDRPNFLRVEVLTMTERNLGWLARSPCASDIFRDIQKRSD
jgi:hypothetical protein